MATQTSTTNPAGEETIRTSRIQRLGLFILFLACEAAIFIFGSYYFDVFPTNKNLTYNLIVSAAFLAASLWFKYDKRLSKYWQISFAFFAASLATPISALTGGWVRTVLNWFAATTDMSMGLATKKYARC